MHSFPVFYGCYLLKSETTRGTYVGSSSNPYNRLRQHNGEIVSGAQKTVRGRPWNIICLIYGFPSVVSALQFEWAWQNPYKTVKIEKEEKKRLQMESNQENEEEVKYPKQGSYISVKRRLFILYNMLTMNAWRRWPLKIRIFDEKAKKVWETLNNTIDRKIMSCMTLEYDIVIYGKKEVYLNNSNNIKNNELLNEEQVENKGYHALKKIDIYEDEMSQIAFKIFEKIKEKNNNICIICKNICEFPELDSNDAALIYSQLIICPIEDCLHVFHLLCLAKSIQTSETENDVLISRYNCPSCQKSIIWGDCIRLQYCILRKTNANLKEIKF
ncbi:hypothetical protein T552_00981 [Pneumocystis carinii B80]|uniref:Uncharacterized protein n=1 Tax=Pneumocystis carinii (strain B80) TaxID=1408658 RepID=A0A0W4ZN25_PNEC8|nr:hypothetical protein T552_00981 [Pneumocystis carinii B80]KTW29774.1 hypothetical protein T552_00981 [Pneumocystis carinii B80]